MSEAQTVALYTASVITGGHFETCCFSIAAVLDVPSKG